MKRKRTLLMEPVNLKAEKKSKKIESEDEEESEKNSKFETDSDEDWGIRKQKTKKTGGGKRQCGKGFTKPVTLSPELAVLVRQDAMARQEVVKKIWTLIKRRKLFDPENRQYAICDDELFKIIGVRRFRIFGMMKYLKNHFLNIPMDEDQINLRRKLRTAKKRARRDRRRGIRRMDSEADTNENWDIEIVTNENWTKKSAYNLRTVNSNNDHANSYSQEYRKTTTLTPELAELVGQDVMAPCLVVKKIWSIINEKNLYDPKNKQFIICDDALFKVIGLERFRAFNMRKYLKKHFLDSYANRRNERIRSYGNDDDNGSDGSDKELPKATTFSPELAALVGQDTRTCADVVKQIWAIIKEKNLFDPKNRRYAICDEALFKVIGVKRFRTFGMLKYLKKHFGFPSPCDRVKYMTIFL